MIDGILIGIAGGAVGGTISGFILIHYAARKNKKDRQRRAAREKLDAIMPLLNFLDEARKRALKHPTDAAEWGYVVTYQDENWLRDYMSRMGTLVSEKIQRKAVVALSEAHGIPSLIGWDDAHAFDLADLHTSVKSEHEMLKAA